MASSGQPETHQDKMRIVIVLIGVIAIILFIYLLWTGGTQGVWDFVKKYLSWGVVLLLIGLVVWVVFKLLQKEKVDLVANDIKDIVDAGILSKPPMLGDLYLTGDKDHGEARLGRIIGYCQLQSYKDFDLLAGLTRVQLSEMKARGEIPSEKIIKEDCFIFKTMPFPFSMFEASKVLRVFEDEHSQLVGDVKIYAVSLIRKYDQYWPNRGHLDIARIDIGVIREAWRGQIHQFLRDAVSIQQRAVGLDEEHKKEMEQRKMLKIPSPLGEQENRGG